MSTSQGQVGSAGGLSTSHPIDPETKALALRFKKAAEERIGREFPYYEPVTYRTQVVAGINFFIDVSITPVGWGKIELQIFEDLEKKFHLINVRYILLLGPGPVVPPHIPTGPGPVVPPHTPTGPGPVVPPHIPTGTGPVVFPTPWAEVSKEVTHLTDSLKGEIEAKLGQTLKSFVPLLFSTLTTFHDIRYTVIVESGAFTYYIHDVPHKIPFYIEVVFAVGHPITKPHLISAQTYPGPLPQLGSTPTA